MRKAAGDTRVFIALPLIPMMMMMVMTRIVLFSDEDKTILIQYLPKKWKFFSSEALLFLSLYLHRISHLKGIKSQHLCVFFLIIGYIWPSYFVQQEKSGTCDNNCSPTSSLPPTTSSTVLWLMERKSCVKILQHSIVILETVGNQLNCSFDSLFNPSSFDFANPAPKDPIWFQDKAATIILSHPPQPIAS